MQSGEGTAQTNRPAGVNKVVYVISLHIKCKCFSCDNNNTLFVCPGLFPLVSNDGSDSLAAEITTPEIRYDKNAETCAVCLLILLWFSFFFVVFRWYVFSVYCRLVG